MIVHGPADASRDPRPGHRAQSKQLTKRQGQKWGASFLNPLARINPLWYIPLRFGEGDLNGDPPGSDFPQPAISQGGMNSNIKKGD